MPLQNTTIDIAFAIPFKFNLKQTKATKARNTWIANELITGASADTGFSISDSSPTS